MISQHSNKWWRNPWVIGMFLIVVTSLVVNGRLIWNSMHSLPQTLDKDYKVKDHHRAGADWVDQQRSRTALGWVAHLHSPQEAKNDPLALPEAVRLFLTSATPQLLIEMRDREGKLLEGATLKVVAQWPSQDVADVAVPVRELAPGKYEAMPRFSRAGNWVLSIEAARGADKIQLEQKVFVVAEL